MAAKKQAKSSSKLSFKSNSVTGRKKSMLIILLAFVVVGAIIVIRSFAANTYLSVDMATAFTTPDPNFIIAPGTTGIKTVDEPNGKKTTKVLEFSNITFPANSVSPYYKFKLNPGVYQACITVKYTGYETPVDPSLGQYVTAGVSVVRDDDTGGRGGLAPTETITGQYVTKCSYSSFKITDQDKDIARRAYIWVGGSARITNFFIRSGSPSNGSLAGYVPPAWNTTDATNYAFVGASRLSDTVDGYTDQIVEVAQGGSITYTFTPNASELYQGCFRLKSTATTGSAEVTSTDVSTGATNTTPIKASTTTTSLAPYCVNVPPSDGSAKPKTVKFRAISGKWRAYDLNVSPL